MKNNRDALLGKENPSDFARELAAALVAHVKVDSDLRMLMLDTYFEHKRQREKAQAEKDKEDRRLCHDFGLGGYGRPCSKCGEKLWASDGGHSNFNGLCPSGTPPRL